MLSTVWKRRKPFRVLKTLQEQQKKERGISNQQVCCLSCVDTNNNHFLRSVCVGRIQLYWVEKNKGKTCLEQTYDIITLSANQAKKIPLDKFKYKPISFDLKGILGQLLQVFLHGVRQISKNAL